MLMNPFSHTDDEGKPGMVDVQHKTSGFRSASASGRVVFSKEVFEQLQHADFQSAKGSIIQCAIIAGTMAAKDTDRLIPFCHALPLEKCKISIEPQPETHSLLVKTEVASTAKTGVEMEALVAVSAACLCIYDMVKALGHSMRIHDICLEHKSGGKNDYVRNSLS
jgi:cyclic pyranopterin phosphate synthase